MYSVNVGIIATIKTATAVEYVMNGSVRNAPWSILVSTKQTIRYNTKTFLGLCTGYLGREYLGGSVRLYIISKEA